MENKKNNKMLDEAMCYLSYAEGELSRPQEDVVTYCACHFTRKSVTDFLKAFLTERKKNVTDSETMEELYTRCMRLEPRFGSVDLGGFACKGQCEKTNDEKYCLSVDHVNRCYAKANEIKDIVLSSTKLSAVSAMK